MNGHTIQQWQRFIDRLLLISGVAFLLSGIYFFFAYNWSEIDKFQRFATLEAAVILATVLAFVLNLDTWPGRLALGAAALLIGPTMGVIGQAYQTGADSYQLFLNWTLFISAWVIISRWNIMYFIWMILINITISFYWWQVIGERATQLNIILLTINTTFVILWDVVARLEVFKFVTEGRWFVYFLMSFSFVHATFLMLDYIFDFEYRYTSVGEYAPLFYIILLIIVLRAYTSAIRKDLLMMTIMAFSLLIVSVSGIGRLIYDGFFMDVDDPFIFFLLMGVITVTLTTGLALQLRNLNERWNQNWNERKEVKS